MNHFELNQAYQKIKKKDENKIVINGIWYFQNDRVCMNNNILTIYDEQYLIDKNSIKYSIDQFNDKIYPIITNVNDENDFIRVHTTIKYFVIQ
jgi:hypothetical protein